MSFSDFDSTKIVSCKLVLLGESAVGKSSLVVRFCKGAFLDYQESTIGASFLTQSVLTETGKVKFEIWDTAGQERYHSLAPMYYRGSQAAIAVYDITSMESFEKAKVWVSELYQQGPPDIIIALVGNKLDLENDRKVDTDIVRKYADNTGLIFFETSAKTSKNVNEVFVEISRMILKIPKVLDKDIDVIPVSSVKKKKKRKSCC